MASPNTDIKTSDGKSRPSRARNKKSNSNNSSRNQPTHKKFAGLDQDELKGIVISEDVSTPILQQCDNLYRAFCISGGKMASYVGTAIEELKGVNKTVSSLKCLTRATGRHTPSWQMAALMRMRTRTRRLFYNHFGRRKPRRARRR